MTIQKVSFSQTGPGFTRQPASEEQLRQLYPVYDVIIVGGGPAGLRAGIEILKQRPETLLAIFEANPNLGGNASSDTIGNHTASSGVLYFSEEIVNAVRELEIPVDFRKIPEPAEGGFVRERFVTGFYDEMRRTVPGFQRFCHDLEKLAPRIGDPITDSTLNATARKLDQQSATQFLKPYGEKTRGILNLYCKAAFGTTTGHISALALLSFFAFEEEPKYTVESGGYGLVQALEGYLREKKVHIATGAPVDDIKNLTSDRTPYATVQIENQVPICAKAVIVTTPLASNWNIFDFSQEKSDLICRMQTLTYLVHNIGPFDRDLVGSYTAWTPGSPFPAIVSNTWGIEETKEHSIRISDPIGLKIFDPPDVESRQSEVYKALCQLYPDMDRMTNLTMKTKVYRHPFPLMKPGFLSNHAPIFRKPEGRVILGGQLIPCMESAFAEGKRAASNALQLLAKR